MKTIINYDNNDIIISAKYKGETIKWNERRKYFAIYIESGSNKENFYFYDSVANYNEGKICLDENDLKSAFCCILSDASCIIQEDLSSFCSSLGYDIDEGEHIYNQCVRTLGKLNDFGLSDTDISDLLQSEQLDGYL